jgi:hypothetical protein
MLDSLEGICPGQAGLEYPATSVPFSKSSGGVMATNSLSRFEYDVALSFAGEDRAYVEDIAARLKGLNVRVFYDEYERANIWGKNLYVHLDDVYGKRARYCVLFASQHYARKVWTNHERESAQARALHENGEYILPVRFDDTEIPGLRPTISYIDARQVTRHQLVALILEKLGKPPTPIRSITSPIRVPSNGLILQHEGDVNTVAFSPDGRSLAIGSSTSITSRDQDAPTALLWDLSTRQVIHKLTQGDTVYGVAFSPNGRLVATGDGTLFTNRQQGLARLWDVSNSTEVFRFQDHNPVRSVAFSPDGRFFAFGGGRPGTIGSGYGLVGLCDLAADRNILRLPHPDRVLSLAFSPDGLLLATGSNDMITRLWEITSGKQVNRVDHSEQVASVAFSPDGKYLATGTGSVIFGQERNIVQLWNLSTGAEVQQLPHDLPVSSVALSLGGLLASASGRQPATEATNGLVQLWDISTGNEIRQFRFELPVSSVAFSPDGHLLAMGTYHRVSIKQV